MQSLVRSNAGPLANPFLGSRMSYRVAAPAPSSSGAGAGSRAVVTMAKKKGVRLIVTIECTEAKAEGGTPSRYVTQKNRKNTPERLELSKYNPFLRRHTLHREIK